MIVFVRLFYTPEVRKLKVNKQEFPFSNDVHIGNLGPRAMNALHNFAFGLIMFG
jgi:hypothetical protein